MKPKVKGGMPSAPKREPKDEPSQIPAPVAKLADVSVAKQKKQKKRQQAKLKRAAKMPGATDGAASRPQQQRPKSDTVEQAESTTQQKLEPVDAQQQQQPKKRKMLKPADAEDKRPRMEANGGGYKHDKSEASEPASTGRPDYLSDTGPVRDPVLRAAIADCLRQRAASTVRVRPLPNRLRLAQIATLCQGIQAARVPWNYATGRNRGVAYLEFASPEAARRGIAEIERSKALGVRLTASIRPSGDAGEDDQHDDTEEAVDVDAYNCRRVVVSALHPHTTGQELKDLVGSGAVQRVDFLQGSKLLRKHAPAVAFLTFADERRALDAVVKFQGRVIRGRGTSWLLQKRPDRPEHSRHPTQLVAFGVSKRVTDADILAAFPGSLSIDVKQAHGMAVISYAGEAECRADFEACKGGLVRVGAAKAKLRVQVGHAQYKPLSERRAASGRQPQEKPPPQPRKPPQAPPKPLNIDPSLFNKTQLILKNFKPGTQEADITGFLTGVRRVFFTPNRRLAFAHFYSESEAAAALEKLAKEPLSGAKLKAMYAMDKPDKLAARKQQLLDQQQQQQQQDKTEQQDQDVSMCDNASSDLPKEKQPSEVKQQRKQKFKADSVKGNKLSKPMKAGGLKPAARAKRLGKPRM